MKTIKVPVTVDGNGLFDADNKSVAIGVSYTSNEQIAELATVLNSHDALVEALTLIAGENPIARRLTYAEMVETASAALKLAEAK